MSDNKWWFEKKFHEKLAKILWENYEIKCEFSSMLSWGYTTTSYYIKTPKGSFTAKISKASKQKLEHIKKDFTVSESLQGKIPTPKYLKNKKGEIVTYLGKEEDDHVQGMVLMENLFLRITTFIEGVIPFRLTEDIISQMVDQLKVIHAQKPKNLKLPGKEGVLLHGDFTPSNVLVSYDKVVAILDFEEAQIGPKEWDLASLITFSWFLLSKTSFEEITTKVLQKYQDKTIEMELIYKFAKQRLTKRLEDIKDNKNRYENTEEWEKDLKFTRKKLSEINDTLTG